jgi:4'-phosphopantetheinyl transferase
MYWLTQKLADVPENDDWLTPNEIICMNKLRFPKRRAEWRLGRWTAKRALASYFGNDFRSSAFRHTRVPAPLRLPFTPIRMQDGEGTTTKDYFSQIEIRAAADGAPEAFAQNQPVPITLSISHRDGLGFCVINPFNRAVGCDLEKAEYRSKNFVEDYFTADERALVERASLQDRHWLAPLIWSAKESTLKALRQGLRMDTRSVIVDFHQDNVREHWNPLLVRGAETTRIFHGWWRYDGEFVQTVIVESLNRKSCRKTTAFSVIRQLFHSAN